MPATLDLRRGQVVGDASRRAVNLNTVSRAQANATYAPIASPVFTGDPKAPTPAPGDNDTSVATTAFVHTAVATAGGPYLPLAGGTLSGNYIYWGGAAGAVNAAGGSFIYGDGNYLVGHYGASGLFLVQNGSGANVIAAGAGVTVGAPFGGDKGAGTLNAVTVYASGTALTSDARLKRDIAPLPDCLPLVTAIEPKSFRWREVDDPAGVPADFATRRNWGFLAQDVKAAPGAHRKDGDIESVDLGGLVATLWQAVRELSAKVAMLEGRP